MGVSKCIDKTILDLEDDAARKHWGGAWRMPTKKELEELCKRCRWTWISQKGVNGYKVVGPNGNSIFLPAAGCMQENILDRAYVFGGYWSSSLDTAKSFSLVAFGLSFRYLSGSRVDVLSIYRFNGYSIRPVCP